MGEVLKILFVEDRANDAALVEHQPRSGQIQFDAKRIDNRRDLVKEIETTTGDAILVDFPLPQLDALDVLEVLRVKKNDTPVVLVTGTLTEEQTVEFSKQGGQDFILKSSLRRLPAALLKAIERRNAERDKRKADQALAQSEERLRLVVDGARDFAIYMLAPGGEVLTWNCGAQRLFGYSADEVLGKDCAMFHSDSRKESARRLKTIADQGRLEREDWLLRMDGSRFYGDIVDGCVSSARAFSEIPGFPSSRRSSNPRGCGLWRLRPRQRPSVRIPDAFVSGAVAEMAMGHAVRRLAGHPLGDYGVNIPWLAF